MKSKTIIAVVLATIFTISSGIWWGYSHLTALVQSRLAAVLGEDLTVGQVKARWNRVELVRVKIARRGPGPFDTRLAVERLEIRPSLLSLFSGRLDIQEVLLENPYVLAEIKPDGHFADFFKTRRSTTSNSGGAFLPVRIKALRVSHGRLDLLDWHIARAGGLGVSNPHDRFHLIKFHDLTFTSGQISLPLSDQAIPVDFAASGAGGKLTVKGQTAPKGLDTKLQIELTGVDITRFRPYYVRKGDLNVAAGTLSGSCKLNIARRHVNAPGTLHLKGLAFDRAGAKGVLLGVPAWALVSFLSDNHDTISLAFTVDGSLDNPRFSIHQSLVNQIASALSSKIGVPSLGDIGRGVLGIFGIKAKR